MEFSPSPVRQSTLQQPLTVENVNNLPQSSKASLHDFVLEQRANTHYYAKEGAIERQIEKANRTTSSSAIPLNSPKLSLSPPLKARVELRTQTQTHTQIPPLLPERNQAGRTIHKSPVKTSEAFVINKDQLLHGTSLSRPKPKQQLHQERVRDESKPNTTTKASTKDKKRPLSRSDEEEYVARKYL
jgi:hypothetical protein